MILFTFVVINNLKDEKISESNCWRSDFCSAIADWGKLTGNGYLIKGLWASYLHGATRRPLTTHAFLKLIKLKQPAMFGNGPYARLQ